TCYIGALSGTVSAFPWDVFHGVSVVVSSGLMVLGCGMTATAVAVGPNVSTSFWVPLSAGLFVAVVRLGLWHALSPVDRTRFDALSILGLIAGLSSSVVFGAVVHLALRAYSQREALRAANRRLEEEMAERRRAEEDAQAANRAKSDFLASMSHEIRT